MNVETIAAVIREVVGHQVAQLKSVLADEVSALQNRLKAADECRVVLEEKHRSDLDALRTSLDRGAQFDELATNIAAISAKHADERKSLEGSIAALQKALSDRDAALESQQQRHADDLAALQKSFGLTVADEIKAVEQHLSEARSEQQSQAAALELRIKTEESVRIELEDLVLRKELDATAEIKAIADRLAKQSAEFASAKTDLEQRIKAAADATAEIELKSQTQITDLRKAVEDQSEIERVAKAFAEIPPAPEIPAELASLPDALLALAAKVAEVEILATGCMRFKGTWDEGEDYSVGATVAYKNAIWVAMRDKPAQPGERDSGWRMGFKSGKLITTPYEHR